ncbi:hypothetical protein EYF80_033901 [Liparis tanakae]|uniref:Uncharacterized protein n=1 Tax=Liparis tanakae TaxID=230148 RepID=A0A4Z2GT45_9TELE|nr:hypothetical protein EYF80_033901 [Liparis tanakae]
MKSSSKKTGNRKSQEERGAPCRGGGGGGRQLTGYRGFDFSSCVSSMQGKKEKGHTQKTQTNPPFLRLGGRGSLRRFDISKLQKRKLEVGHDSARSSLLLAKDTRRPAEESRVQVALGSSEADI